MNNTPTPTPTPTMHEHASQEVHQHQQIDWGSERDPWIEDDILDMETAFAGGDDFPTLPDLFCISPSSSSSSSVMPINTNTNTIADNPNPNPKQDCPPLWPSSSSSPPLTFSWDDQQMEVQDQALLSTDSMEIGVAGYMNITKDLCGMDLTVDPMDSLDTACLYPSAGLNVDAGAYMNEGNVGVGGFEEHLGACMNQGEQMAKEKPSENRWMVFHEWLKSNKELLKTVDLKTIRLKKSTIESAMRRLGGTEEGMRHLVKLILEWVELNKLRKKRIKQGQNSSFSLPPTPNFNPYPNPSPNLFTDTSLAQWVPHHQPCMPEVTLPMCYGYNYSEPTYNNGAIPVNQPLSWPPSIHHFSPTVSSSYTAFPPTVPSAYTAFPDPIHPSLLAPPPLPSVVVPQTHSRGFMPPAKSYSTPVYPNTTCNQIVRLGLSATKEARKKRMARQQKRLSAQKSHKANQNPEGLYCPSSNAVTAPSSNMLASNPAPPPRVDPQTIQPSQHHRISFHKNQAGTAGTIEKNLKFLLQKVLRTSDVGYLGRIVLPKKESEMFLPELDTRDSVTIAMEDIGTSRIWNMRYRYWPNNNSRMYLIENAGEFLRLNGLQKGDFIVIYSDMNCGKYLIRGVKVRPLPPKPVVTRQDNTGTNVHASFTAALAASSSTNGTRTWRA